MAAETVLHDALGIPTMTFTTKAGVNTGDSPP